MTPIDDKPPPTTSNNTTSVSVGGNVGGNIVTGNSNKVTPVETKTPWWEANILQTVLGWLFKSK